jgi:MoxR-like ATPase
MVLATQNPIEHHGTYPLPESQMDRFLIRIRMGYPSRETEKEILRSRADARSGSSVHAVMEARDVLAMQQAVSAVRVDDSLLDYVLEIIEKTRQNERLILGVSPRGSLMLQRAAQARAFIEGRDFCLPDDFKQLVIPVFAHRVVVNARYATTQKKTVQAETILAEMIESTPVPL